MASHSQPDVPSAPDIAHISLPEKSPSPTPTPYIKSEHNSPSRKQESPPQPTTVNTEPTDPPLSKNAQKKQLKRKLWAEGAQDRKRLKREKRKERTTRKRHEKDTIIAEATAAGKDVSLALKEALGVDRRRLPCTPVPVSFIVDCDFEKFMLENELVSLGNQITRCYSQNRAGKYQAHLVIASWKGKLKERFETVLENDHLKWRGVTFVEDDFVEAGGKADELMRGRRGGKLITVLGGEEDEQEKEAAVTAKPASSGEQISNVDTPRPAPSNSPSIVYLTADSPHTLTTLEPYTSYVIGGLVDRNREKNICYRRAQEKGVRTAKLPISEHMQMSSRKVLATNHVVEIMARWLETGDWGDAFMAVMPKRKGGTLRRAEAKAEHSDDDERDESETGSVDDQNHDAHTSSELPSAVIKDAETKDSGAS